MSSVTNITIRGSQDVDLGRLLGRNGCRLFERELQRLAARPESSWSQTRDKDDRTLYLCRLTNLPAGVSSAIASVHVSAGVIQADQQSEYAGAQTPADVRNSIQRLVNQAVNQVVVNTIAENLMASLRSMAEVEVRQEQFAVASVQLHARRRIGGTR